MVQLMLASGATLRIAPFMIVVTFATNHPTVV
jgi:hypothetical protein